MCQFGFTDTGNPGSVDGGAESLWGRRGVHSALKYKNKSYLGPQYLKPGPTHICYHTIFPFLVCYAVHYELLLTINKNSNSGKKVLLEGFYRNQEKKILAWRKIFSDLWNFSDKSKFSEDGS